MLRMQIKRVRVLKIAKNECKKCENMRVDKCDKIWWKVATNGSANVYKTKRGKKRKELTTQW